jgi:hypothetical protein
MSNGTGETLAAILHSLADTIAATPNFIFGEDLGELGDVQACLGPLVGSAV